jgi:outer membrane immunogenic protein
MDNQSHRLGGGFAGGQAGYNYQFHNNVVLGIESDFQWSEIRSIRRDDTAYMYNVAGPYTAIGTTASEMKIGQNWFGTTRLRLGYQFADRFLAYATGGLAYSQFSAGNWGIGADVSGVYSLTNGAATLTRFGWAAGAGVEYALNNHLSIKSEYLYSEYAGVTAPYLLTILAARPITSGTFSTGTLGIHLVRAGLNYRLGDIGQTSDIRRSSVEPNWRPAWGGFYVGVNGGYGVGVARPELSEMTHAENFDASGSLLSSEDDTSDMTSKMRSSGFLAGGQFGYNRQLPNRFVAGLETDLQWSGIRAASASNIVGTYALTPAGFSSTSSLAVSQNWFGTTRLRLGYQPFDRVLVYGTGGVAYSGFSTGISGASTDNRFVRDNVTTSGSGSSTRFGRTVGAGVEYAVTEHLSLKTEYLYSQYSGFSVPYQRIGMFESDIATTQGTLSTGVLGIHAVRAGLNWNFGSPGH